MINENTIEKSQKIMFNRQKIDWLNFSKYINNKYIRDNYYGLEFLKEFKQFKEENLIIPLDFQRNTRSDDEKGCRVFDWKILNTEQVKNAMKIEGNYDTIEIDYAPSFAIEADELSKDRFPTVDTVETYNKFLNITYMVDDSFLTKWIMEIPEENISKKKVDDCSVRELLFAIKNKLNNKNESNQ